MGGGGANSLDGPKTEENIVFEDVEEQQIEERKWVDFSASGYAGGTGKKNDPYQISCAEELAYFSVSLTKKNDSSGKYYVLTNDIFLNDGFFQENGTYHDGGDGILYSWTPVGSLYSNFYGEFDGQGNTVFGFYINSTENYRTFIYSNDGTIKNLKFKNTFLKGGGYSAVVTGATCQKSVIENVYVDAYVFGGTIAGIAGSILYGGGKFINCEMHGKINATGVVGGILVTGNVRDNMYYENCNNYADVKTTGHAAAFGIAKSDGKSTFINCNNYGDIVGKYQCAGIGKGMLFEDCNNYGDLRCENGSFAGVAVECTQRMTNCKNYGFASVGLCYYNYSGSVIENCENYGNTQVGIVATNYAGAIVNRCKSYSISTFNNPSGVVLTNYGYVKNVECYLKSSSNNVRGVCGELKEGSVVENVIFDGEVAPTAKFVMFGGVCLGKFENVISLMSTHKQYYGNDFSKFNINWKTGKIGLNAFDSGGLYQRKLTENHLIENNFSKKTT